MKELKGRSTIRRNGSATGVTGTTARVIKRWGFDPQPNTTLARLQDAYLAGLNCVDQAEMREQTNKTNKMFTPDGARDDLMKFVWTDLVPTFHKARMTIAKARQELAERRAKLTLPTSDPQDLAAALRRREIRDHFKSMDDAQQRHFFSGADIPSEVLAAVLEMPPQFSGVPSERYSHIRERALQSRHGPEIAETAELEVAIAASESAVETGRDEVRRIVGGITQQEFDAAAAHIEAKHSVPWLRKRDGNVHVVDLERRVERHPTDEELATGIFANTHDEYLKEQTTLPAVA
jgi:hypothetical protein